MKNALKTNMTTPVSNLGRWRPIHDLKKDRTLVLVWNPNFQSHQIMAADVCQHHHIEFWQPLDPPPSPVTPADRTHTENKG